VARAAFAVVLTSPVVYPFDLGQATAYMQLAAWELGVGSCIASLHEPDKARSLLGIPGNYQCDTAISFGYAANQQRIPLKAGGRLPLDQIVHWEHW
jgi:nitroreductase